MRYRACPVAAVVFVPEGHAALVQSNEAAVRDGDAMGVAAEIGKHCLRPGEGRLGVDEPVLALERREMRGEGLGATQALDLAKERQPACRVGIDKRSQVRKSRRNRRESTRTGRRKLGLQRTQRVPSSDIPPPGTII